MTTVLGCLGAGALAYGALLVIVYPESGVRPALAVLTPLVVVMAFFGSWRNARCPRCSAGKSRQTHVLSAPIVTVGSRPVREGDDVTVDLGWNVELMETITCRDCGHEYASRDVHFVSRDEARSATEAGALARQREARASN